MSYIRRPAAGRSKSGVTARFDDHDIASRATRALQKELRLRPEDVSVAMAPGIDANTLRGKGGYIGITKAGAVLVHARSSDPERLEQIKALLRQLGGKVVDSEHGSVSSGGYGPTTANGTRGVFGGAPTTSAMANHLYTHSDDAVGDAEKRG